MQFAKDSFSMALRERLAALNPARTVMLHGSERPAVVVLENEVTSAAEIMPECFYLQWGKLQVVEAVSAERPLCAIECEISYFSRGSVESGVDRGRVLGELDRELFMICQPPNTPKLDFSQIPNVGLGTGVFWTLPEGGDSEREGIAAWRKQGDAISGRVAKLKVFFFAEVKSL